MFALESFNETYSFIPQKQMGIMSLYEDDDFFKVLKQKSIISFYLRLNLFLQKSFGLLFAPRIFDLPTALIGRI